MSGLGHISTPADGWHGSRFTGGLDASKGTPAIAGQIYRATDTGIVYIGKDDLTGWDVLFYVGVSFTPQWYGIKTTRTPALTVVNNTNTDINHSADTVVFGDSAMVVGTTLKVPAGKGGKWWVSMSGRWSAPNNVGDVNMSIQNSVGSGGGVAQWDGGFFDNTHNHAWFLGGMFDWPALTTFNLRAYHLTSGGSSQTLQHYTVDAYLVGTP